MSGPGRIWRAAFGGLAAASLCVDLAWAVAPPTGVTATPSGYSIALQWSPASGIFAWEIQRRIDSGYYQSIGYVYTNSYRDSNLTNGSRYYYRLRAWDSTNSTLSAYSAEVSALISVTVPTPQLTQVSASASNIAVRWTTAYGTYAWELQRRDGNGAYTSLGEFYSGSYDDYSVTSGQTYTYRVRGRDTNYTWSAFSSELGATVPNPNSSLNNGLPESAHPYADYTDQTWTYSGPAEATALNLVFDARTFTENGYDFITILDGSGNLVAGPFSGSQLAGAAIRIPGNSARIRLTSDESVTGWGFAVTSITAVLPPPPAPPSLIKPAAGAMVTGAPTLSWTTVDGASAYRVEWSSNAVNWTAQQVSASPYVAPLTNGAWQWRVSSVNSAGSGPASPASVFTLAPGYALSSTRSQPNPDRVQYQVTYTPYRSPAPASLSVQGLPPSVGWTFTPPTISGASSGVLELSGVTSLVSRGPVTFSVMSGTVPVDGGQFTLAVTGQMAIADAHAYPNPARGQTVRLKISLTLPPSSLKLRLYDLSGALVREVSESAPFSAFTAVNATDYEYAWNGANGAGHGAAAEKYIYWIEARDGATTVTTKGLFTYLGR